MLPPSGEETTSLSSKKKPSQRCRRRHEAPVAPEIGKEIDIKNDAAASDVSSPSSSIDKWTAPLAGLVTEYHRLS